VTKFLILGQVKSRERADKYLTNLGVFRMRLKMRAVIFILPILFLAVGLTACEQPAKDDESSSVILASAEWGNPTGLVVASIDAGSGTLPMSSRKTLFAYNASGDFERVQFFDAAGNPVETDVRFIKIINDDYFALVLPSASTYLVNKNAKTLKNLTNYLDPNHPHGVIRNGYFYSAFEASNTIYKTNLTTGETSRINDPGVIIDVQMDNGFPGFYVSPEGHVVTIAQTPQGGWVIFFDGVGTYQHVLQNISDPANWCYATFPSQMFWLNTFYGENGKLYTFQIWTSTNQVGGNIHYTGNVNIHEFTLANTTTFLPQSVANCGTADSYVHPVVSNTVSYGPIIVASSPNNHLGFSPGWHYNWYTMDDRHRYSINKFGYFTLTSDPNGGMTVAWQARDYSSYLMNPTTFIGSFGYSYGEN
jgi:hypothetical protein